MTSPTNHEGGTEPGRRVGDEALAKELGYWSSVSDHDGASFALKAVRDLVDARATIAALRERAETAERERDEARLGISERTQFGGVATIPRQDLNNMLAERVQLKDRLHKAEASLRDREQRGGQVTEAAEKLSVAWDVLPKGDHKRDVIYAWLTDHVSPAVKAVQAALAIRPTGQPSDPAEARIAEAEHPSWCSCSQCHPPSPDDVPGPSRPPTTPRARVA